MSTLTLPVTDPLELIPTLADEPVTRRDVLLDAARLIEKHGHRVDCFGRGGIGFCILGAVGFAAGLYDGREGPGYSAEDMFKAGNIMGVDAIKAANWSDLRPDGYPVIAALRALADGATWEEATA